MATVSTTSNAPVGASGSSWFETNLARSISTKMLIFFVVGDIIGGGIYALVGTVAGQVGGAVWSAFALAFLLAMLTAASYAELVTKYPRAGGAAVYVERAYRSRPLAFVTGIAVLASGLTSAAALATAFGGDYFQELLAAPQLLVSLLFIGAVAMLNFRGISESVKVNVAFTVIEVIGLLIIVGVATSIVAQGQGDPGRVLEFNASDSVFLLVLSGAALAFYSFVGFEDTANLAEEVQDPAHAYPRALLIGLAVAGMLYLAVTSLASMAVDTDRLAGSDGPLLEVIRIGGGVPLDLFALIGLFAVANGALINMVMASRLLYGMAHMELVPRTFGKVHQERRTPWVAILFTSALAAGLIATGDISDLASTTSLLLVCVFILVNGAVLLLRREQVGHEHFSTPWIVPVLGIVVCVALLTQQPAGAFMRAGVLVLGGVVLWFAERAWRRMVAARGAQ